MMIRKIFLILFFLFVFSPIGYVDETLPRFSVLGVKNHVKDKEWKDAGIGFGISNLISQYVYDTGKLVPFEENEEVKEAIKKHRVFYWQFKGKVDAKELLERSGEADVEYVFFGEVTRCKKYRKKAFVGFVSKYQTTIKVFFTIHVVDKKTGEKSFAKGEGVSKKGGTAAFFEAKDGAIDFNSTMVGLAAQEAVKNSVEKLMADFHYN